MQYKLINQIKERKFYEILDIHKYNSEHRYKYLIQYPDGTFNNDTSLITLECILVEDLLNGKDVYEDFSILKHNPDKDHYEDCFLKKGSTVVLEHKEWLDCALKMIDILSENFKYKIIEW